MADERPRADFRDGVSIPISAESPHKGDMLTGTGFRSSTEEALDDSWEVVKQTARALM
jgi:hypothetical protein